MRANITKNGNTYAITSAQRPGGANKKPRTRCIALTDCVCTDRDGNITRVIPRTTSLNKKARRIPRTTTTVTSAARRDILLQATMGSIHPDDQ